MATKSSALAKIEELRQQIERLKLEAIEEVKQRLHEARKLVAELEEELAEITGQPSSGAVKVRRPRRPSIGDEELRVQLLKAMAAEGLMGLNARQLADKAGHDAPRVRKFIKDNPKALKRQVPAPVRSSFYPEQRGSGRIRAVSLLGVRRHNAVLITVTLRIRVLPKLISDQACYGVGGMIALYQSSLSS